MSAIRARVTLNVLDDTMDAFPTFARLFMQPVHELSRQTR